MNREDEEYFHRRTLVTSVNRDRAIIYGRHKTETNQHDQTF